MVVPCDESELEDTAVVSVLASRVGLAVSCAAAGDAEIWLGPEDCLQLIASLQQALRLLNGK
jgi:hypothetical protein